MGVILHIVLFSIKMTEIAMQYVLAPTHIELHQRGELHVVVVPAAIPFPSMLLLFRTDGMLSNRKTFDSLIN